MGGGYRICLHLMCLAGPAEGLKQIAWQTDALSDNWWWPQCCRSSEGGRHDVIGRYHSGKQCSRWWEGRTLHYSKILKKHHHCCFLKTVKGPVKNSCWKVSLSYFQVFRSPTKYTLSSMVSHFQKLFDVTSLSGVYPRMNEVYTRLGEMTNMMRNLRDVLELGDLRLKLH